MNSFLISLLTITLFTVLNICIYFLWKADGQDRKGEREKGKRRHTERSLIHWFTLLILIITEAGSNQRQELVIQTGSQVGGRNQITWTTTAYCLSMCAGNWKWKWRTCCLNPRDYDCEMRFRCPNDISSSVSNVNHIYMIHLRCCLCQ